MAARTATRSPVATRRARDSWAHVALLAAAIVAVTLSLDPLGGAIVSPTARAWLQVAAYALLVAVTLALALGWERRGWASLGFERRRLGWQVAWAGLLLVILVLAFIALPLAFGLSASDVFGLPPADAGTLVALLAFDLLCVGFGEELIFRGYLLDRLSGLCRSGLVAVLLTSVLFGAWHLLASGDWVQCLLTAAVGLILGLARIGLPRCTTLSVAIAHGCYDAAIVLGALWWA